MKTVLVGLSGGVDSAATALLMQKKGFRVYGAFLSMVPGANAEPARRVAERLGIPFSVVHREKSFRSRVICPFVAAYQKGETPNPCVECNRKMKIASLLAEADRLGIDFVATGHYARIERDPAGRYRLKAARDENKDQSYFLWKLTQRQLSRLIFPLADLEKDRVRLLAEGLIPPREKESMEICFVPDNDTKAFLEGECGSGKDGYFVDSSGKVLGKHKGICAYTVGQRRGLGVSAGKRIFVTEILPEKNLVVLGEKQDLETDRFFVRGLHFVSRVRSKLPQEGICVRGRHRGKRIPCRLSFADGGVWVNTCFPVERFAPGQSACFYLGNELLFGGEVAKNPKKDSVQNVEI